MYQPKPSRSIFGVASMDLFASALGAFVILTIVSLPFFMNSNRSEESQPMVEQYNRLYNQNENLRQQLQQLQQQNERISINDLELLLLVDFSNSYASFLDGLEYELRTLAKFWNRRGKKIHLSLLLYGDQNTRYPTLQANMEVQGRDDLSAVYALLHRIRSDTFQQMNDSHLNRDGPEALHLALEEANSHHWSLPEAQRFVFVHYDNICYPQQMENCTEQLHTLSQQVASLFMKYTQTATSVDREQAIVLAQQSGTTFIDSGQSWTLQIFNSADIPVLKD